ncbi:MAG: MalY/PatB family protein [Muribaculaceae bacterium]
MKYDFDEEIDRRGTGALKYDALAERYGNTELFPLWVADMDFAVCPEITAALQKRLSHPVYGYAQTPNSYWLTVMRWLNKHFRLDVKREELNYIPGVVKGISFAINYFTQKGDKVLIQPPVYHPFRMVTEGNGRIVVNNPLVRTTGGYQMDFTALEATVKAERPKLMILCNPHNPGGIKWTAAQLAEVARIARQNSMIVISDEIHADIMLDGEPHVSFLTAGDDAREVGIVFGAPSKTFNIAGLVSSWAVIQNPELRKGFYEWLDVNEFSDPTFISTIAAEAAYSNGEPWLEQMIDYINGNIDATEKYLAENVPSIKMIRPQASFLVWLDCRQLGLSQKELVSLFVDKAGLALNDGEMFGKEGVGYMRLNVGTNRVNILKSLEKLKNAVDSL